MNMQSYLCFNNVFNYLVFNKVNEVSCKYNEDTMMYAEQ